MGRIIEAGSGEQSTDNHERKSQDCNPLIAETLAESSTGIGDNNARKKIAADKETKLGICDAIFGYEGWRERCDRLELKSHSSPRQEEHCEDQPSVAHVVPNIAHWEIIMPCLGISPATCANSLACTFYGFQARSAQKRETVTEEGNASRVFELDA